MSNYDNILQIGVGWGGPLWGTSMNRVLPESSEVPGGGKGLAIKLSS